MLNAHEFSSHDSFHEGVHSTSPNCLLFGIITPLKRWEVVDHPLSETILLHLVSSKELDEFSGMEEDHSQVVVDGAALIGTCLDQLSKESCGRSSITDIESEADAIEHSSTTVGLGDCDVVFITEGLDDLLVEWRECFHNELYDGLRICQPIFARRLRACQTAFM